MTSLSISEFILHWCSLTICLAMVGIEPMAFEMLVSDVSSISYETNKAMDPSNEIKSLQYVTL